MKLLNSEVDQSQLIDLLASARQQFVESNIERDGDFFDVVQRDVPSQPLDMSDEGSIQASFKRQRILRPTMLGTQALHVQRQQRSRVMSLDRFSGHLATFALRGVYVTGVYVTF